MIRLKLERRQLHARIAFGVMVGIIVASVGAWLAADEPELILHPEPVGVGR